MRTRGILSVLCLLAVAGLSVLLVQERQGRLALEQANAALRQRLSRVGQLNPENQSPPKVNAGAAFHPEATAQVAAPSSTQERELLRLRGEVGALRRQAQELESLREDTRRVRATQASNAKAQAIGQASSSRLGEAGNGSQLEIVSASYWTDRTNLDVAAELRDRIRGDSLKAVASNNLGGDPEYGTSKRLTVVYRFAGLTRTNQFNEGDLVVLPSE